MPDKIIEFVTVSRDTHFTKLIHNQKPYVTVTGVVDCPDFSDELYCKYCPEHHFHCGVGQMCVPKDKMCDGVVDCDNAADEKGCCKFTLMEIQIGNK